MGDDPKDSQPGPEVAGSSTPLEADQRREPRFTLIIRTAKLIADGREFLCIIRGASARRVKLQLFHPLPATLAFQLEMDNADRYPIELAWSEGEYADFRFPARFNLRRLVSDPDNEIPKRQIRLRTPLPGMLILGGEEIGIKFENISQQGASIDCDRFLAIDQLVKIEIGNLPPLYAKVRWRKRPRYGVIFEQTFQFEELVRRLAP